MNVGERDTGGFSITEVKCPSCGGPLQLPDGATSVTCGFCGSTMHVNWPQPAQTGIDPDGTIRDRATGYGLFRGRFAPRWTVAGTSLARTGVLSRPYVPQAELRDRAGAVIHLMQGDAGTRRGTGMSLLTTFYGQAAAPYDTSNYAEMPDPLAVADQFAAAQANGMGATALTFQEQLPPTSLEGARQRAAEHYSAQARAWGLVLNSFFGAQVIRTYSMSIGGEPWQMAVLVEAWGAKGGLGGLGAGVEEMGEKIGGLFNGLGGFGSQAAAPSAQAAVPQQAQGAGGMLKGALDFTLGGGLIGKKMREARAAQQVQAQQTHNQPFGDPGSSGAPSPSQVSPGSYGGDSSPSAQNDNSAAWNGSGAARNGSGTTWNNGGAAQGGNAGNGDAWCVPGFAEFNQGGTVYWSIDRMAALAAPQAAFAERFTQDFLPLVEGAFAHPDVLSLSMAEARQADAAIQASTQQAQAASWSAFNAQQAAHRQQQAAFNSYNESISAARDSRQASFRAATNAQFAGAGAGAGGHAPADFSEAIRGANTYVTSDGREVELSVHSDVAYENQAGDVMGGSAGFDPGADWTQISRA